MKDSSEIQNDIKQIVINDQLQVNEVIARGDLVNYLTKLEPEEQELVEKVLKELVEKTIFTMSDRGSYRLTEVGYKWVYGS